MPDAFPEKNQSPSLESESSASQLLTFGKGVAMGLGDSVPGVSGGTIAVITNIYERLIYAIRAIDLATLKLLFAGHFAELWRHIDGAFLLVLATGILTGLLVSANSVLYLLDNHVEALMAFFIGLVLASSYLLKNEFHWSKWSNLLAVVFGLLLAISVGAISPRAAELTYPYVFFSGMIAICAMILPGLSGAFILLLLGVYEFILTALIGFDLPYIFVFVCGCAIGLLAFSRLLAWLLRHYHQLSYGFITGMLLGSVSVLWPWQHAVSFYRDSEGILQPLQTANLWPLNYMEATGKQPMLLLAFFSFLIGLVVVLVLHRVFNSKPTAQS